MIDLLILVEGQNILNRRVARPYEIEVLASLELLEAAEFHRVDDSVVNVGAIRIEECHE